MLSHNSVNARAELQDLAIFGRPPAFCEPLHVGRPNLGDRRRTLARINDALDRRWLTNGGPLVEEFERRVAELTGVEHCVAVASATAGLQLLTRAIELSGEVILPSFTFVGTAHALGWLGLAPVFCDIDPQTHNLDPDAVERAITPRTTAIVGVHLWGRACDVGVLSEVSRRHGLRLVFDAAHALACSYRGRLVGSFGDAEVFSFHATKVASTGEGGAVTTNDPELAERLRLMRNFGFTDYDTVLIPGTNAKLPELSAAIGLTSLESLPEFIDVNRRNFRRYELELLDTPGIHVIPHVDSEGSNYQYVVVEIDERGTGLARDDLITVLHTENVLARRYFHPGCHRSAPYRDLGVVLPVTEQVSGSVVTLPTGTSVEESDIVAICRIVRLAAAHGEELRRRLRNAEPPRTGARQPGPVPGFRDCT